jgi:CBS domain-containing protein
MHTPVATLLENKDPEVHTMSSRATVFAAVQEMISKKIGSVLVMEGDTLVGIFTERDVLVRVVGARRDPMTTPIAHVMTQDPVTIPSSMTIEEVLDLHGGKQFRHLPVVDGGRVVGMISFRDILQWIAQYGSVTSD